MDQLHNLDPRDLGSLLTVEPERLLGRIMELNHTPRYHNSLNAIVLLSTLVELQRVSRRHLNDHARR